MKMEISGNKYLHKKFKKQTSCNPVYNVEDKNDNSSVLGTKTNNGESRDAEGPRTRTSSNEEEPVNFLLFKDNKLVGSVPNYKSTNCDGSLVIESQDSKRTVERNINTNANVVKLDNQSSISNVEISVNIATNTGIAEEPVDCYNKYPKSNDFKIKSLESQTVSTSNVTSCISNIIPITTTSTSLLDNDLKENSVRNFSFDTKVSISEPIPNIEKSSILETVYSKTSLISERPNAASIKLDVDEYTTKTISNDGSNMDNIPEKKPNCTESTGGKYVCTYCNLACSKPSVLQKHIRAHTNERPYPCVSCGFSFKTRSNLYKHCRSRTHANRVMGNKHVQVGQIDALDVDCSSEKNEIRMDCTEDLTIEDNKGVIHEKLPNSFEVNLENSIQTNISDVAIKSDQKNIWEQKAKPYKPRFHTAKIFFEENRIKDNDSITNFLHINTKTPKPENIKSKKLEVPESQTIKSNPDLLKLRINELINKNNSIVNCDEAIIIRRRNNENIIENNNEYIPTQHIQWLPQPTTEYRNVIVDEPLNLTAKNRKRCLSDSDNTNKSLIKELLLKNLSSDPNLQCPYCKMIFQTVTELEMHKIKYCNAKHSNIRYARSSSVNVASILTQNKNAFDNIPHMQYTTFPLKSPGPFLGKTRLIDSEKYRTFSFDDNVIMHHSQSDSPSFNKYMLQSPIGAYPLSPQIKKNPIKLFGGEVKITQTSGETRSFKIESESINKMEEPQNFMEFSGNLSENLVIKSTLQSGGTVLQNKTNYSPKMDSLPSPNIIRVYDNTDITSNLNLSILNDKSKFTYDKIAQPNIRQNDKLLTVANNDMIVKRRFLSRDKAEANYHDSSVRNNDMKLDSDRDKEIFKSNLMDFGQKAVKLLAPNLKPPNLTIPGLPIPSAPGDKLSSPIPTMVPLEITSSTTDGENVIDRQHQENLNFAKKQITLQQRMAEISQPQTVYNPMNIVVNGKVIRYVPGIPGPIAADAPTEMAFSAVSNSRLTSTNKILKSPRPLDEHKDKNDTSTNMMPTLNGNQFDRKTPTIIIDQHEPKLVESKSPIIQNKERIINNLVSRENKLSTSPEKCTSKEECKKFIRPDSLALKPNSVTFKNHHGLTPTMFNQALISPDTPRVAKKYCQQYLNGNYFSYLGLKSSTKSVYCTLNKTQPFYVKHFKKLSMYSEWRQQESKIDCLSVSAYDSRQKQQKYTMSGHAKADLIAHSSYKFIKTETQSSKEDNSNKNVSVLGGYESNEEYTYIRGRGRGRYVCDQCGIRCKKPSMLKKHIRTHSDDRPYTCEHCNFSFKTKGNLTKHMKSKAHSKKYAATSSASTQNSTTTSSESEESDAESSDESTRLQEHEAAHCLLSLSQKNTQPSSTMNQEINILSTSSSSITVSSVAFSLSEYSNFLKDDKFLKNPDQINQVTNTNFAKNKILDETSVNFNTTKHFTEVLDVSSTSSQDSSNVSQYLGKSSTIRPLTYPYQQTQRDLDRDKLTNNENVEHIPKMITSTSQEIHQRTIIKSAENKFVSSRELGHQEQKYSDLKIKRIEEGKQIVNSSSIIHQNQIDFASQNVEGNLPANIVFRKRKLSTSGNIPFKVQRRDSIESSSKVVDLSMPVIQDASVLDLSPAAVNGESISFNGAFISSNSNDHLNNKLCASVSKRNLLNLENKFNSSIAGEVVLDSQVVYNERASESLLTYNQTQKPRHNSFSESNSSESFSQNSDTNDRIISKMIDLPDNPLPSEKSHVQVEIARSQSKTPEYVEQDQSAMQTLADIAIKQVKLEKNILAKNVASEYLKFARNTEGVSSDGNIKKFASTAKESVNELIVKPEESKNCTICSKIFSKPSQLRLHMNIHYLERPFRCESCSVSFRTRGHLQKHERSASHHNKLSSSPALSSQEPRPFKCTDCNIAFRIHGHLAKHLRSKMHIMKLECLAKIPFGLYAELERANSLLTEINTTDGDLCLESLKILARKLFSNDPSKLDQIGNTPDSSRDS